MTLNTEYSPANTQPESPVPPGRKKKAWILPTAIGVVAFLTGLGAGSADTADLDAANASLASVTQERDAAQKEIGEVKGQLEEAESAATAKQAELDAAQKDIEDQKAELEEERAALEKREKEVSGAEKEAKSNTFSEGRWIVGEDIKAGTYKTTEPVTSTSCYWAITSSGSNGDNIIANDFGTQGNHTVTLKKGQDFESQQCGDWKLQK